MIDSFALDQSPNIVTHGNHQHFYPGIGAASYVLKDR